MKEGIHPNYQQTTITCACGNVIETGSTKKDIKVEVCSKCHPFFTGKQKLVDTGGRVARFNKKFGTAYTKWALYAVIFLLQKEEHYERSTARNGDQGFVL